jgi:hypothetical protein
MDELYQVEMAEVFHVPDELDNVLEGFLRGDASAKERLKGILSNRPTTESDWALCGLLDEETARRWAHCVQWDDQLVKEHPQLDLISRLDWFAAAQRAEENF